MLHNDSLIKETVHRPPIYKGNKFSCTNKNATKCRRCNQSTTLIIQQRFTNEQYSAKNCQLKLKQLPKISTPCDVDKSAKDAQLHSKKSKFLNIPSYL